MAELAAESVSTPAPPTRLRPPRRWLGWLATGLALAGAWVSFDLLRVSAGQMTTNPLIGRQCNPSTEGEKSACRSVLASRWAFVPADGAARGGRVPVAALGLGYFGIVALWYLFVGPPSRSRWGWHLPIALVVVAGAVQSFMLVRAMAVELRQWCELCVAAHALNAGIVILTFAAFPWKQRVEPVYPSVRLALATLTGGAIFYYLAMSLGTIATLSARERAASHEFERIAKDPAFVRWKYEQEPAVDFSAIPDDEFEGPAYAPNTIVAFIDPQCPACRRLQEQLDSLAGKMPDRQRVTYRYAPMDRECDSSIERTKFPGSCLAARAIEAARRLGGPAAAKRMKQAIRERDATLDERFFEAAAANTGIDAAAFRAALASPGVSARIESDIALGRRIGLIGMPVLYVNGRRLEYWTVPEAWTPLLRE